MTQVRFIHTADLHLGRRFGNFPETIRGRLVEARHGAIGNLAAAARAHGAGHVLVAGDVFDSETPSDQVWRQAVAAMAAEAPMVWWIIPGNHDSLAAESLWERFRAQAPDNVRLLDAPRPVEIETGVALLPAPASNRFPGRDLTEWMSGHATPEGCLRLGLAHGSIVDFGSEYGDPETIPPDRAATAGLDYLALGDWHGFTRVGERTYYSGTPERDRFKHSGKGVCAAVVVPGPGAVPSVTVSETGRFDWSEVGLDLTPEQDPVDVLMSTMPRSSTSRRDCLVRIAVAGWTRLPLRMELAETIAALEPEFGHLEFRDNELLIDCMADDLDEVAASGALRIAADTLLGEAKNESASRHERAVASAALRRLYGYTAGSVS